MMKTSPVTRSVSAIAASISSRSETSGGSQSLKK
jgi:hypothetical protein